MREPSWDDAEVWSPRERGCSESLGGPEGHHEVVPARAGVFRAISSTGPLSWGGPRASGGVPAFPWSRALDAVWSPRERRCSAANSGRKPPPTVVPARAGVFRSRTPAQTFRSGGPRASGGVPVSADASQPGQEWSPRERGCSELSGFDVCVGIVVPARAGVFRPSLYAPPSSPRGPRASGGVPTLQVRPRGLGRWSPRERGCSGADRAVPPRGSVVPARAGVFRRRPRCRRRSCGPRASVGVPETPHDRSSRAAWSPRERGRPADP